MVTRKAFIKQDLDVILPITRAELVLDSKGTPALESELFVATSAHPGLITPKEKTKIAQVVIVNETVTDKSVRIALLQKEENNEIINIYPVVLSSSITDMDEVPTEGHNNVAVSSGGTWKHIDDIVGDIQRVVTQI